MLLSSILIDSSDGLAPPSLPRLVEENVASFRGQHPALSHQLFGQAALLSFIEARFPKEVLHAFLALKPYAYKADLARYCVMYELGGVYADLSYFFLRPLPLDGHRLVVFRDFMWSSPWDASNGVFAAPPRHKVFELAIEMVCANVRRNYHGPTSLCPTGPALFGKALATACEPQDLVAGLAVCVKKRDARRVAPTIELPQGDRLHCLMLGEDIVAVKRKPLGSPGLKDLGVHNGNRYFELWRNRDVYDPRLGAPSASDDDAASAGTPASALTGISRPLDVLPEAPGGLVRRLWARLTR